MLPVRVSFALQPEQLAAIGPTRVAGGDWLALVLRAAQQYRYAYRKHPLPIRGGFRRCCGGAGSPLVNLTVTIHVIAILRLKTEHILGHGHAVAAGLVQVVVIDQFMAPQAPDMQLRLRPQVVEGALAQAGGAAVEHAALVAAIAAGCRRGAGVEVGVAAQALGHLFAGIGLGIGARRHCGARTCGDFHHQALSGVAVRRAYHHIARMQACIGFLHAEDAIGTGLVARSAHHIGGRAGEHPELLALVQDAHGHQRKLEGLWTAAAGVGLYRTAQVPRLHGGKAQACRADIALNAEQGQGASALGIADGRDRAALLLRHAIELVDRKHAGQANGQADQSFQQREARLLRVQQLPRRRPLCYRSAPSEHRPGSGSCAVRGHAGPSSTA